MKEIIIVNEDTVLLISNLTSTTYINESKREETIGDYKKVHSMYNSLMVYQNIISDGHFPSKVMDRLSSEFNSLYRKNDLSDYIIEHNYLVDLLKTIVTNIPLNSNTGDIESYLSTTNYKEIINAIRSLRGYPLYKRAVKFNSNIIALFDTIKKMTF